MMTPSYKTKQMCVDSEQFYQFINYCIDTEIYDTQREAERDNFEQGFQHILNEMG